MSNDLKDILSNSNRDIDNQQLMDYLSNHLSNAQRHELEKAMSDDAFVNDAVEGLQHLNNKQDLQAYVEQLNDGLKKQIAKNKQRKEKRRLKDSPYTYLTVIILLLLIIIGFLMVKKYRDMKKTQQQTTTSYNFKIHKSKE